jgi:hypothetical protein
MQKRNSIQPPTSPAPPYTGTSENESTRIVLPVDLDPWQNSHIANGALR